MKITLQFIFLVFLVATIGITVIAYTGNQSPKPIDQPAASPESEVSIEEALLERRSIRSYQADPMTLEQVSQLLWAAQGIIEPSVGF